jgi:hypothetical protein
MESAQRFGRPQIQGLIKAPVGIAPSFLPDLKFATVSLSVAECEFGTCKDFTPPRYSRVTGLPGLQGLLKAGSSLQVLNTALPDMTSLGGLICPLKVITITNNSKLQDLSGLENLGTWTQDAIGPRITIAQNPKFDTAQAVIPGLCQGPNLTFTGAITVSTTTCSFEVCSTPFLSPGIFVPGVYLNAALQACAVLRWHWEPSV